jgi:hypothetical protein
MFKLKGKIKVIMPTVQVSEKFAKRELVITTDDMYPQDIMFQFTQDKCNLLEGLYVNQNVEVFVVIKPEQQIISVKTDISAFFEKWAGFFKEITIDDIKYNYLMDKHK